MFGEAVYFHGQIDRAEALEGFCLSAVGSEGAVFYQRLRDVNLLVSVTVLWTLPLITIQDVSLIFRSQRFGGNALFGRSWNDRFVRSTRHRLPFSTIYQWY